MDGWPRKSFTLIELLIVITIIGILAVALVPRISQGPARARDVQRKADLQNLAAALELYYADNGEYPNSGSVPSDDCLVNGSFVGTALKTYIELPADPQENSGVFGCSADYYYKVMPYTDGGSAANAYALVAAMEIAPGDTSGYICVGVDRSGSEPPGWASSTNLEDLVTWIEGKPCPDDYAYYVLYH